MPGFKAQLKSDLCLKIVEKFPLKESRWTFIEYCKGDLKKAFNELTDSLPEYLFKGTYTDVKDGVVKSNSEDLKRSSTIKAWGETLGQTAEKIIVELWKNVSTQGVAKVNWESITEIIAHDLVGLLRADRQIQYVYPGEFPDKSLALLMLGTWIPGADLGGKDGSRLAGDKGFNKYLAQSVLLATEITHREDSSVKDTDWLLICWYLFHDWDTIGKESKNKRTKPIRPVIDKRLLQEENNKTEQLVCIDFGKAFNGNTFTVKDVLPNFKLNKTQPVNYSIFTANRRSDIFTGIIRLAKLKGEPLDETILKSYGETFIKELSSIEKGADELLFADYMRFFQELSTKCLMEDRNTANHKMCAEFVNKLKAIKEEFIDSRDYLIKKFEQYLKISKQTIDLVENIEHVMFGVNNLSLLSPDGKVILNHLRVTSSDVIEWDFNTSNSQEYIFTAKVNDSASLMDNLKLWFKNNLNDLKGILKIEKKDTIKFIFNPTNLKKLMEIFAEDRVKELLPEQHLHYKIYKAEMDLPKLLKKYLNPDDEYAVIQKFDEKSYQINVPKVLFGSEENYADKSKYFYESCKSDLRYISYVVTRENILKIEKELLKRHQEKIEYAKKSFARSRIIVTKTLNLSETELVLKNHGEYDSLSLTKNELFNEIVKVHLNVIEEIEWIDSTAIFPREKLEKVANLLTCQSIEVYRLRNAEITNNLQILNKMVKDLDPSFNINLKFAKDYLICSLNSQIMELLLVFKENKYLNKCRTKVTFEYRLPAEDFDAFVEVLCLIINNFKLKNENNILKNKLKEATQPTPTIILERSPTPNSNFFKSPPVDLTVDTVCNMLKQSLASLDPQSCIEFSKETSILRLRTSLEFFNQALKTKNNLFVVQQSAETYLIFEIEALKKGIVHDLIELNDLVLIEKARGLKLK